ncbi:hypothetical protein [Coprobacter sp.]
MRREILITILLSIFFLQQTGAQITTAKKAFQTVPSTKLPYEGIAGESLIPPRASVFFPYKVWGNKIDASFWIDYGLTVSTPIDDGDCSIFRRFVPTNGQYFVGVINLGLVDYATKRLITATPEGEFIDCLEVSVFGYTRTGVGVTIKQWKIDADMRVTVYQVKPTSTVPIKFEETAPFTKMNAQRIDTRYRIDETGHIKKVKETKYQPQDYLILDFTGNRNIWDGEEQPVTP